MIRLIQNIRYDKPLVVLLLLAVCVGQVILYSAGGESQELLIKQSIRVFLGFSAMIMIAQISPEKFYRWAPYIYALGIAMLIAVIWFGVVGKGAQRWLNLGFMRFQPSEIMKFAVPLMTAWVVTKRPLPPSLATTISAFSVVIVPMLLIMKQPDLGTALMIGASGLVVIFLAGFPWKLVVGGVVLGLGALPMMFYFVLHDYQRQRVMTLFDPWSDPLGSGYHTIQSIIAIGSGGNKGKGWLNGSQSQLEFIPERQTDFIFSVFAEEFGFIGFCVLMLLYLGIVLRGLYIAFYTQNTFSRLLAGSLSLTFFFYVFVNIGMVSGILPVVGVPLPLISYGGTSMVTLLASFGILMSVRSHRNLMSN